MQHEHCHKPRRLRAAVAVLGMLALVAGGAWARKARVADALAPTHVDQNARGRAQLVLHTDSAGKFQVLARHLDPRSTFEVLVNQVKVGTLTTNGGGNGNTRFRSRPHRNEQLLGFDPRGATVTVRNEDGQDVLEGTVPDDTNPDEVPCCLADRDGHEEVECENRTADECAQEGGTVSDAASCLPNPCTNAPPVGDQVVCCIPPDSASGALLRCHTEAECETLSQSDCTAAGGTVVAATSCDPNPCLPTPPPAEEVVCCVPDHEGVECEVLTPERCSERGGAPNAATSCDPDPCSTGSGHHGGHE